MADGRLVALLIASPAGAVIHERFHARLSELERADVRAAMAGNAEGLAGDGAQAIGRYRGAVLVSHVEGGLVLHGAGTGDCDELTGVWTDGEMREGRVRGARTRGGRARRETAALPPHGHGASPITPHHTHTHTVSRALRSLGTALKAALGAGKRPPTPAAAFEGYGKVVLALDDLAYEGVLDCTDAKGAARAARLRGGVDG